MLAGKVAAANQIPNHYRRRRFTCRFDWGRRDKLAHVLAESKHEIN